MTSTDLPVVLSPRGSLRATSSSDVAWYENLSSCGPSESIAVMVVKMVPTKLMLFHLPLAKQLKTSTI